MRAQHQVGSILCLALTVSACPRHRAPKPITVGEAVRALEQERHLARLATDSCYGIALKTSDAADSLMAQSPAAWRSTPEGDSLIRAATGSGRIVVQVKVPPIESRGHADSSTIRLIAGSDSVLFDEARRLLPRYTFGTFGGECPRARVWTTLWRSDSFLELLRHAEERERRRLEQGDSTSRDRPTPPDISAPPT